MADGDINVTRIEPISPRDHALAERRDVGQQDLLEAGATVAETKFEYEDVALDAVAGEIATFEVLVFTVDPTVGAAIPNHVRGGDPLFGVKVKIASGSGYFLSEDGRVSELVLTGFKNGRAKFAFVADDEGAVGLSLEDSEATGLDVSHTATITVV